MSKRLAITISGAVSLGSYEAGVLYEVLDALAQHNSDPKTTDDEKIFVDVLTGASAGGMTATIAAQKLLFEAGSLTDPYKNSFYQPWVADVSLDALLTFQPGEDHTQSLFSSKLIEQIADRHMTVRYHGATTPARRQHPAAADTIQLGLTLANLNGVDFSRPVKGGRSFTYTRHKDQLRIGLDAGDPSHDTLKKWLPLRDAAISCGAFPIAFRAKELIRLESEYPARFLVPFVPPVQTFTYTDGGLFQNEPLGMAKDFVDGIDDHRNNESRFYLFVAPGAKSGSRETQFSSSTATVLRTTWRMAMSIFAQSRFQDWIMAEKVNDQVAVFNRKALALRESLGAAPDASYFISADTLRPAAAALLDVLYRPGGIIKESRGDAWARLRHQFATEYDQLAASKGQGTADVWIDAILAFETAAELGQRDEMAIYGITATDAELASENLSAFGGFFDRRFRDHDYLVGREKAQAWLLSQRSAATGEIGPIRFTPKALPVRQNLGNLEVRDLPESSRRHFRQRVIDRADDVLTEMKFPGPVIFAIRNLFIKPQLNKLLEL